MRDSWTVDELVLLFHLYGQGFCYSLIADRVNKTRHEVSAVVSLAKRKGKLTKRTVKRRRGGKKKVQVKEEQRPKLAFKKVNDVLVTVCPPGYAAGILVATDKM